MKDEKKNREKRRRRRVKNQIFAYLTLLVLVMLILTAGYFGARGIIHSVTDYNDRVNRVVGEAESSVAADQDSEPYGGETE